MACNHKGLEFNIKDQNGEFVHNLKIYRTIFDYFIILLSIR